MALIESRKRKLTLIVLITAFWLVMNAELVRREAWLPRLPSGSTSIAASLSPDVPFKEQWMGIYFAEQKVGYSNTTVTRRSGDNAGYLILNRTFMVVEMMNTPLKVRFEGLLSTDPAFKMRNFTSTLVSAGHRIQIDGELEGDTLSLSVLSGGKVFRKEMKVSEDLNLSNSLTPLLFLPDLETGKTYTVDILNPLSFTTDKAKVTARGIEPYEYEGKTIDVYVVDTEYQGITFTAWVTETGDVLKESTPLGWTLLREDRDVAADFREDAEEFRHDIARILSVPSDMRIEEPERTRALEMQLSGVDFGMFRLEGAGQHVLDAEAGLIRIEMRRPDEAMSLPLPITDEALAEHLRPTLLIQSDDESIQQLAKKIAGDERNSLLVAERINEWVFDNVQKQITFSLPSAVEVLESRQGDCNEHTVLYAALARAAGIPTKVAIGLVYYRGSFYYHAWPEVYVGEWVALDPTFGQAPADATHIKLLEGELDQQSKLMPILGKIKVSIRSVSYEAPPGKDVSA